MIDIIDPEEDNDHLGFEIAATYVMGTLLAFNLYNKIKSDSNNLIILFKLIDILGNNDLNIKKDLRILEQMDINFFDVNTGNLKIDEGLLKELEATFKKELESLQNNNIIKR